MLKIPEITKRNFRKILKELDLSEYPSLKFNTYLLQIKEKLEKKQTLTLAEELMSFHKFNFYLKECKTELNNFFLSTLDFSVFSERPPLSFQEDGVKFLLKNDRCILADDTGIGKSIQSILASLLLLDTDKILVITLKSLKYNFEREISFYSSSYKVIEKEWKTGYKFTIVHYQDIKKFKKEILAENFECIIIDEAHNIKNQKAARTQNVVKVIDENDALKKLWLLTGTPISNRPYDFYNLLKLIKHPIAKNWKKYVEDYCAGYQDEIFGQWIINGSSNLEDLHNKTKDSILRRLKIDFLADLPSKSRQAVFLKLNNKRGYSKVIKDYKEQKIEELIEEFGDNKLLAQFDVNEMTKLMLWRQFCALEKIRDGSLLEIINSNIEEGNKIIVFTNFTSVVDAVYETLGPSICRFIDGRISDAKERLNIIDEFNANDDLKVCVLNLKAGGTGLNIQSANVVIINDMSWVPAEMWQAEDRAWRIGQKREVTVFYLVYLKTVETLLFDIIDKKAKAISTIIEGREKDYFENETKKEDMLLQKQSVLRQILSQIDKL